MHVSIKSRLALAMGLMSLLLLVVGMFGVVGMTYSNADARDTFSNKLPGAVYIGDAELGLQRERTALLRGALDTSSAKNIKDTLQHEKNFRGQAREALDSYMKLPQSPGQAQLARDLRARRAAMDQGLDDFAQALLSGDSARIMQEALSNNVLYGAYHDTGEKLRRLQYQEARLEFDAQQHWFGIVRLVTLIALALGLLTAIGSFLSLRRAIGVPLGAALSHFEHIAQGDLTHAVRATSRDEMGQLLHGIAHMQERLLQTVRNVRSSSDAIALSTAEVAAGNQDLSARTEAQAASLQETAASMEELTSTVKHNTDNAQQASQLAATAHQVSAAGNELVEQVIETMSGISDSSGKIAEITSIIEGIAFQTNILALNAAVEAARAGDNGRGFAVVAAEVRSLAQRSSSAAREIKDLIGTSVERVRIGNGLVARTGTAMEGISTSIKRVSDIVGEIATASREQSRGIEQVNQAIAQMDSVTQQNAALVEQAAAAAISLQDQGDNLRAAVVSFRVGSAALE